MGDRVNHLCFGWKAWSSTSGEARPQARRAGNFDGRGTMWWYCRLAKLELFSLLCSWFCLICLSVRDCPLNIKFRWKEGKDGYRVGWSFCLLGECFHDLLWFERPLAWRALCLQFKAGLKWMKADIAWCHGCLSSAEAVGIGSDVVWVVILPTKRVGIWSGETSVEKKTARRVARKPSVT